MEYLVNSLITAIGINPADLQKKVEAINGFNLKYREALFNKLQDPNYQTEKAKKQIKEPDVLQKVASLGNKPKVVPPKR